MFHSKNEQKTTWDETLEPKGKKSITKLLEKLVDKSRSNVLMSNTGMQLSNEQYKYQAAAVAAKKNVECFLST